MEVSNFFNHRMVASKQFPSKRCLLLRPKILGKSTDCIHIPINIRCFNKIVRILNFSHRIKHKLALSPGHWHVRVKSKNTEGWSAYSTSEDIISEKNGEYHHFWSNPSKNLNICRLISDSKTNSASGMAASVLCAISLLTSIYSINFSPRLFG